MSEPERRSRVACCRRPSKWTQSALWSEVQDGSEADSWEQQIRAGLLGFLSHQLHILSDGRQFHHVVGNTLITGLTD